MNYEDFTGLFIVASIYFFYKFIKSTREKDIADMIWNGVMFAVAYISTLLGYLL